MCICDYIRREVIVCVSVCDLCVTVPMWLCEVRSCALVIVAVIVRLWGVTVCVVVGVLTV